MPHRRRLDSPAVRWALAAALVGVLAVAIAVIACKPSDPRQPARAHRAPGESGAQPDAPSAPGGPVPPARSDAGVVFDPDHPCFNRGQLRRAKAALFQKRERPDPDQWLAALNQAFFDLHADCKNVDLLLLTLTTIQMESNVWVDPPVANPNLEQLYLYRLRHFREEHLFSAEVLSLSGLSNAVRAKLRKDTRGGRVRTEADLDRYVRQDLRPWLLVTLQKDYLVPQAMAESIIERSVLDPVRSIGPMQVNVDKAYRDALQRGEKPESAEQMKRWLLDPQTALLRGLKEGIHLLMDPFLYYQSRMPTEQAVLFASADYNAGEFSSRNAAFQEQVSSLTRRRLELDGDLLSYRSGMPEATFSQTEEAVNQLLQRELGPEAVRRDLLLEKRSSFSESPTAQRVCALFEARRREPCKAARLPIGAGNPLAEIKLGRAYNPADYAYGYVRRFQLNRTEFDQAEASPTPQTALRP